MTKENNEDVLIPCFGDVRGCKVAHCNIASDCYEMTLYNERYDGNEHKKEAKNVIA
jgi:hypothetical protein